MAAVCALKDPADDGEVEIETVWSRLSIAMEDRSSVGCVQGRDTGSNPVGRSMRPLSSGRILPYECQ